MIGRLHPWLEQGVEPVAVGLAGDFFCTSGVPGFDLETGQLPERAEDQFELAFTNLAQLLAAASIGLHEIGLVTVNVPDREQRRYIDQPWLELFPDALARPARKTNEIPLPGGLLVQLQATGLRGSRCRSIEIPGLSHRAPIPMGALVGSTVFSSVIGGEDPATGALVSGRGAEIAAAFDNAERLMQQAGGTAEGINHMWVFLGDMADASAMLEVYLARFSDPHSRPSRKTLPYRLPEGVSAQLQVTGDIHGRTRNFDLPGVGHHDPIPLASQAGRLLQSSGIYGIDPATSRLVEGGLEAQTQASLEIIERLLAAAGGTPDSIAGLTVIVDRFSQVPRLLQMVERRFRGSDGPAARFVKWPLPPELAVQFHLTAWL